MYDRFVRKLYLYLLLERIYPAQNNPVRLSCLILSDLMFRYYIARVFGLLKNILDMIPFVVKAIDNWFFLLYKLNYVIKLD